MRLSSDRECSRHVRTTTAVVTLLAVMLVARGEAAYLTSRPIVDGGGVINQYYLWGEGSAIHRGVDLSYPLGTPVYGIANGTVVDLHNELANGEGTSDWGNYVLIQHDQRHFDRASQQEAYVYSMYLHLSQWSVRVAVGEHVSQGTWIAEVDDTGRYSEGNHLHLQVVVHPQANRTLDPFTLDSENRSRNPELWLSPYGNSTGRVVGKVTSSAGIPVGGLLVWGLQKQPGWGYATSQTYMSSSLNSDDILGENWATTDVLPGQYHITLSNGSDMGWHTVEAGRTTYVGLYPVWLPDVRGALGWTSTVVVRNNSPTYTADVYTGFLNAEGSVRSQAHNLVPPREVAYIAGPGSFVGSALVVSSEDVSAVAENRNGGIADAYNGIAALDPSNRGWGQVGTALYAPSIMYNFYGWYSQIKLVNTGFSQATVDVTYYPGGTQQSVSIPPNGQQVLDFYGAANQLYSARIVSDQPLAGTVTQSDASSNILLSYNLATADTASVYAPLLFKNYYGWDSSLNIQNGSGDIANVWISYFKPDGSPGRSAIHWLPLAPYSSVCLYLPAEGLYPDFAVGAANITSDRPLAIVVNSTYPDGGAWNRGVSYTGFQRGSKLTVLPDVLTHSGTEDWVSSVNVHNLSPYQTTVTLKSGGTERSQTLPGNGFVEFYTPVYLPAGRGPATVETPDRDVAVVVNHCSGNLTSVDLCRSYDGLVR
jgi:hypothetical protein